MNNLGWDKFRKAAMLRRTYVNWASLVLRPSAHRRDRLILRNGVSIVLPPFSRRDLLTCALRLATLIGHGWNVEELSKRYVVMRDASGTSIRCRSQELGGELFRLTEIYLEKVYGYNFEGKSVIDIGMCNGESSIFFARRGARIVVGLEPSP